MAAFLVSPFGAAERTWKPFNPVLGETFEADKLQNDAFFVAEQVRAHAHSWDDAGPRPCCVCDCVSSPPVSMCCHCLVYGDVPALC